MDNLESLYNFIKVSTELKKVERKVDVTLDRAENSAEHSWSVALYCWLLQKQLEEEFKTQLNTIKLFKMAVMHDLVEIKAGDISAWDQKGQEHKKENEDKAARMLFATLPKSLEEEFFALWNEYEAKETLEAKIAKGVDRLSGAFQHLTSGQGWSDVKATTADMDKMQLPRIEFSKTLLSLYEKLKQEALASHQIENVNSNIAVK
jgi:putative hydrolase of HD superfamily